MSPIEAFTAQLVRAADAFMVMRDLPATGYPQVPTVIAGYHWFTDWGRDTMIAPPRPFFPTGRMREAG